ncbi:MAG: BMC domain-containing protein [Clostridiaceae bacterium]|nr:BMC domain-containing protein [Clostridiaceae bacterium]
MKGALGLIEAVGLTTAITALDAATKAADVTLVGYEKVIGASQAVSVTIQLAGEVAAVKAAVEAGVERGNRVGTVLHHHIIPRPHEELDLLIETFEKNLKEKKKASKGTKKKSESKKEKEEIKKEE